MQKMQDGKPLIVSEPVMRPHRCAVIPFMTSDPDGFIDTGVKLPGFAPRVYVSATGVRELAKGFGFPTPEEYQAVVDRATELESEVERLTEELRSAQRKVGAIEALEAEGFRARKRPGRPPGQKKETAAAA